MLKVGAAAPDFQADDQHGRRRTLDELLGRGRLALYFYPRDFTPGCTTEACSFRDHAESLAARGMNVVGVSTDGVESHARFAEHHGLNFPLLADLDRSIARAFGALQPLVGVAKRATFVIDRDRTILGVFHHEILVGKHLRRLEALMAQLPPSPT